ncbi:MAG: hypothetical protein UR64_C0018G0013 [Candidatus Nomurabacteria bacterium GW2011_GWE1_35_16]|uniref:Uncharacterized protein n=1 Tax=Candidatus Nomurabacteria bacterium GW2011_GWE1_35_16 TaxID=1618761 RepID=A0A0G0BQ77_9BACT|nr:MAG: hypothetical protein UR64_C0018G0013 [Candidatus Nomurabacteria bacterium GW2011_GWE1_35_16]
MEKDIISFMIIAGVCATIALIGNILFSLIKKIIFRQKN